MNIGFALVYVFKGTRLTRDGPAKSANWHRILKIHNFVEKSNIKNYNGLVAAVHPVGCIKTFQIATRSTETSECEIFSYIIMISVLKFNLPVYGIIPGIIRQIR